VLRRALGDALRQGLVTKNVAAAVERPKAPRPEMQAWEPAEASAFLDSVAGDRLEALWHLLLLRGLRRGEALGLRWNDVDLDGTGGWRSARRS
jgi:integrase